MKEKHAVFFNASGIFLILFSVFMLTFNGVASTDDEQLFLALTESMASGRGYSGLPLFGNDRLQGGTGSVEPLHSAAGIPLYFIAAQTGMGKAQILFMLPAFYTALTASLLYLTVRQQGYDEKTAIFSAFAFGAGTIAFPYARMQFREPLAALAFASAAFFMLLSNQVAIFPFKRALFYGLTLLSCAAAVLTKVTSAVILPVLFIAMLIQFLQQRKQPQNRNIRLTALLLIAFLVLLILIVNLFPQESFSRFTLRFINYIRYTLPRLPHEHFLQAVGGLLFSPGKGIFIYSPVLLFALASPFSGKHWAWITGLSALLMLTFTQALIYDDAWWGITWGTRSLLPVLPLVVLAAAPALDRALTANHRFPKALAFVLLFLSILFQVGRLFASDPAYVGWLTQVTGHAFDSAMQWEIALSPVFRYFWLGSQVMLSDIAWLYLSDVNAAALAIFISLTVAMVASGIFFLSGKGRRKWIVLLNILFIIATIPATLVLAKADARYFGQTESIRATRETLCSHAEPDDLILIDYYLHPFWWYYSNWGCQGTRWAGLPYVHQTAIQSQLFYPRLANTEQMIRTALQTGDVFLVTSAEHETLSYQQELTKRAFQVLPIQTENMQPFSLFLIAD